MQRDRILVVIAAFLAVLAASPLFAWLTDMEEVFPRAQTPLDSTRLPISFLIQSPGSGGRDAMPSVFWIPFLIAAAALATLLLRPLLRRILLGVLALAGAGCVVLLVVQVGRTLEAVDSSDTAVSHIGIAPWIFLAGCVLLAVAAILGPGKPAKDAKAGSAVAVPPSYLPSLAPYRPEAGPPPCPVAPRPDHPDSPIPAPKAAPPSAPPPVPPPPPPTPSWAEDTTWRPVTPPAGDKPGAPDAPTEHIPRV